jgi:hypothetical protein
MAAILSAGVIPYMTNCKDLAHGEAVQTEFAWTEDPLTESAPAESILAESAVVEAVPVEPALAEPSEPEVSDPEAEMSARATESPAPEPVQLESTAPAPAAPDSRRQAPFRAQCHSTRYPLSSPPSARRGTRSLLRLHSQLRFFALTRR